MRRGLVFALSVSIVSVSVLAYAVPLARSGASGRFVSKQYGYSLALPHGWSGVAATTSFPGGDIDHTASYSDLFSAPDQRDVFALGQRTKSSVDGYTRAHSAWLTANRPCRSLGKPRAAKLSGSPARITVFACDPGPFGRTYVVKWATVRKGRGLIFTQFSPDGKRAADEKVLSGLVRTLSWK